ncbi:TIGR00341 family protein [Erythrobacter sp. JK5]|uniref:TIGR00341 family protein n=1 Tax=Erythrobacter sp. JK5 TaxID=2829500 RepID=UPI001BA9F93B|nr:TIGR00341 family protein [Erythrobacter sp. JK5]QUL36831.1 TIGR00341 family protein [Erythrobacter sp. JK5]
MNDATSSQPSEPLAPSETPERDAANRATEQRSSFGSVVFSLRRWWLRDVIGTVDQAEVIEKRREDCAMSERYMFMTAMSAGIAVLGLLLSSPAVVIGAMLLSPLMGPIMGLGFALAIGDYQWLKQSARSLGWGTLMAIGLTAVLVYLSPIQTITPEIASRTQPNLFDLFVALFSALAGAYAMIRGREGTIVGVAIATALMPPLATVGFGLATWNWTVFSGALLLYVTNLITIALTAWGMARLYGFKTSLSSRNTLFQNVAVAAVFIGLAVPLAFSLQQIAWQTNAQRIVRAEIEESFQGRGRLSEIEIEFAAAPIAVNATMLTPVLRNDAESEIERALSSRLGQDIELTLTQFQVGTSASAAEQAQLTAARANEEAAAVERAEMLARRLALVAGVTESDVTVDRTRRRATVRAQELEDATLTTYRILEQRIAATEPEWTIELVPPVAPLPSAIAFEDSGPTIEGARALSTIAWAATRIDLPVVLVGDAEQGSMAAEILARSGVDVTVQTAPGTLRAQWGKVGSE